jgi:hypothetical protein
MTATAPAVAVKVLLGSTVRLGFKVRVGRGVRLGLRPISLAVLVGGGGMVGVVVFWTGVLVLAQAFNNNEDSITTKVSSRKLRFIFILSILLGADTNIQVSIRKFERFHFFIFEKRSCSNIKKCDFLFFG